MKRFHPHFAVVLASGLALAACSSATSSGRASLTRSADRDSFQTYDLLPTSRRLGDGGDFAGRPAGNGPALRRFAAMPRYKPHAPHVRQHESSCLNSGLVQATRFIRPRSPIGNGSCYIAQPFRVYAVASGGVRFDPPATLRCQMLPSVETWVRDVLRPAARRYLGSDVVRMRILASYACRSRNSVRGAKLSEHGRANAIDISKFILADGRVVTVKHGWRGSARERRFLRYIHRGACEHFSTVLGPDADRHHHDHFHLDLARHGRRGTYRVCS